ncbi:MAG: hypothetical protein WCJ30_23920, partial [Deltaproteobacteria bacterium]
MRTKPAEFDEAFFERYFGKAVKSRPVRFEDYSSNKLKKLGYKVPDWKQLPESSAFQAIPQDNAAPVLATTQPPTPVEKQTSKHFASSAPSGFPIVRI